MKLNGSGVGLQSRLSLAYRSRKEVALSEFALSEFALSEFAAKALCSLV